MSRRRKHQEHEEEHENSERWLLTYADMITLLLALFIVLFAISTVNQKKFLALALGLKQSFNPKPGVLPNGNGVLKYSSLTLTAGSQFKTTIPPGETTASTIPDSVAFATSNTNGSGNSPVAPSELAAVQKQVKDALTAKGLASNVTMVVEARGLVVQVLTDKVFFQSGQADIQPGGVSVIDTVAGILLSDSFHINVEGYTDNQPLTGGPYSSNEELSAVRAVNVVLRMEADKIPADRLSATGYGATHFVAPNNSPTNMALNRRIDIVVLSNPQVQNP